MYKGNSIFENGSQLTDDVCLVAGFSFCNAIKTRIVKGVIHVKATILHPSEVSSFQALDNITVNNMPVKIMNFRR